MRRAIIDAHHHLWDLEACHYPWLVARGVQRFFGDPTPIQKNYLPADLLSDARSYELRGSVHIQVGVAQGYELRETAWVQSQADATGLPNAIIAFCALESADALDMLSAHQAHPCVRGVRQILGRSDAEDAATGSRALLRDPRWREHLGELGHRGLSFDLQLTPGQMHEVADVLAATPDTPVALCHCGSPWDQTPKGLERWRAGLEALAALPQVLCKISGLGMFNHQWTVDDIRPLVETCIDVFGAARCMFGSNFPVDSLHASYDRIWQAFELIAAELRADEQQQLFGATAQAFYRIDDASLLAPASTIE